MARLVGVDDNVDVHYFASLRVEHEKVGLARSPTEDKDQPRRFDHRIGDPGLGDEDDLGVGVEPQQGSHVDRDVDRLGGEHRARRDSDSKGHE